MAGLTDDTLPTATTLAATDAYEVAGLGPRDLDVVECQDTDAARELMSYEELGLCPAGGAAEMLDAGVTSVGGRLPVNPSGGLLSKGEPLGASALGQVVELVHQLRGAGRSPTGPRRPGGAGAHRRTRRQRRRGHPAASLSPTAAPRATPGRATHLQLSAVAPGVAPEGEPMSQFTVAGMFRANVAEVGDRPMFRVGGTTVTWAEHHRRSSPGGPGPLGDGVTPGTGWRSSTATDWPTSKCCSAGLWPEP